MPLNFWGFTTYQHMKERPIYPEVIEPEELRERVKESLTETLATYEGRPQPVQEEKEIYERRRGYVR